MPHVRAKNIYFSGNDANTTGTYGKAEIGVFSATANGNVAPLRTVKYSGFVSLTTVTLDPTGAIWACDFNTDRAYEFAASASGNVAPIATLGAGATGLDDCNGLAVSSSGNVFMSSFGRDTGYKPSIFVWKSGAGTNAAPFRTIVGHATGLQSTAGSAFDSGGKLFVSTGYSDTIEVFAPASNGNAAPLRTIAGANTGLSYPPNIAIDPATDNVWAANESNDSLTEYAHSAQGNAAPLVTIKGSKTKLNNPYGVAVDAAGYVYAGNCQQGVTTPPAVGSIVVFAPGASGNVAPVQVIKGSNAYLTCVGGLAVK
jgi:sugar lactone lactonase YvrE